MKKNKSARRRKIKVSGSERRLKICAVVISLLFTVLMLYPLVFSISSSMKDNSQIYEIPPRLLPVSYTHLLPTDKIRIAAFYKFANSAMQNSWPTGNINFRTTKKA